MLLEERLCLVNAISIDMLRLNAVLLFSLRELRRLHTAFHHRSGLTIQARQVCRRDI